VSSTQVRRSLRGPSIDKVPIAWRVSGRIGMVTERTRHARPRTVVMGPGTIRVVLTDPPLSVAPVTPFVFTHRLSRFCHAADSPAITRDRGLTIGKSSACEKNCLSSLREIAPRNDMMQHSARLENRQGFALQKSAKTLPIIKAWGETNRSPVSAGTWLPTGGTVRAWKSWRRFRATSLLTMFPSR
jgi:hypothetical protein